MKRNRSIFLFVILLAAATAAGAAEKPFELHGIYLEGCSCKVVCTCDLNGEMAPGCRLIGVLDISSGSYGDADLSGTRLAAVIGDKWVRIYIQAKDPAHAKTAGEFGRSVLSGYGKIESVRDAKIDLTGKDGAYTLTVDDGSVASLTTKPVLGADGKTAITYSNYPDPLFQTIMQAQVVSGSFTEGGHHFELAGSNSFFNQQWSVTGKD